MIVAIFLSGHSSNFFRNDRTYVLEVYTENLTPISHLLNYRCFGALYWGILTINSLYTLVVRWHFRCCL